MCNTAKTLLAVPSSPVTLVFGLTGLLNKATAGILDYMANFDPPDGNYLEIFDAPDWSFGKIVGAGAAGNALVRHTWALFAESLNMVSALERFQGANLAGDATVRAAQEAAFDAAFDRYNTQRVTVSDSITAYLADVQGSVADINLKNDTSLADLQAYIAGLTDPATEDPLLAAWIASMSDAMPALLAQPGANSPSFIAQAVADTLDAIATATPSGLTGSAFAGIVDAAADLATSGAGPTTYTAGAGGDFATITAAMTSGLLTEGDIIGLLAGLTVESATVTVDNLTFDGDATNTGISLKLGGAVGTLALTGAAPIDVTGNGGANLVTGNAGANTLRGGNGQDTLKGAGGKDVLQGGAGNDVLNGGAAKDVLAGDGGADILKGGAGNDRMGGGAGADRLLGQGGDDIMAGAASRDTLLGGAGDDTLRGGAGNDVIKGGAGTDLVEGGTGNDRLWGGAQRDVFLFDLNGGNDTIKDFADDVDTLRLNDRLWGGHLTRAQVLQQFGEDVAGDVVLTFLTGTLTIENMTLDALRDDLAIL